MIARALVQPGDTIITLAARLTGDPRAFADLIALNDLTAPYVTPEGRPGTLAPGDAILYPRTPASPAPLENAELDVLTYKRDLIEEDGHLRMVGSSPQRIAGTDNLRDALKRRLRTPIGAHPAHPTTYGSLLLQHVGTIADQARAELIRADAVATVQRDPRVQSASCRVVWEGQAARIDFVITPIPPGTPFDMVEQLRV